VTAADRRARRWRLSSWDMSAEGRKASWGGLKFEDYRVRWHERRRDWQLQVRRWVADQDTERLTLGGPNGRAPERHEHTTDLYFFASHRCGRASSVEWASLYAVAQLLCCLTIEQRNQARRARRQPRRVVSGLGATVEQGQLFQVGL
jgi:hypothetical protein